jgi:hypothetical protein
MRTRPGEWKDDIQKQRKGDWMQTYTGLQFWPLDPKPEEICIEDIAHALSMMCRYNGHCQRFYSVAEHSVLVSLNVDQRFALHGLLHDASEAYFGDIIRPIKPFIDVGEIALGIDLAIFKRFNIDPGFGNYEVKRVDNAILVDEMRELMPNQPAKWYLPEPALCIPINCWSPEVAKRRFLKRFEVLTF